MPDDLRIQDDSHLTRMPGWYVYRGTKPIVGPCVSKAEAESFIIKLAGNGHA